MLRRLSSIKNTGNDFHMKVHIPPMQITESRNKKTNHVVLFWIRNGSMKYRIQHWSVFLCLLNDIIPREFQDIICTCQNGANCFFVHSFQLCLYQISKTKYNTIKVQRMWETKSRYRWWSSSANTFNETNSSRRIKIISPLSFFCTLPESTIIGKHIYTIHAWKENWQYKRWIIITKYNSTK